jgi:hypothetical protein
MNTPKAKSARTVVFPYHSFRNISCPEDLQNERKVFAGHAPVTSVLDLPTDANVRDYLLEAEGKQRKRETQVNKEIRQTLESHAETFSILNGGLVIVARSHEVDEQKKVLYLTQPSIIDGSQTQGVLKDYFNGLSQDGDQAPTIHVKYELIVTNDEDLIGEVSIARNFQNDVASISIAGRRGQLEELEESLRMGNEKLKLQKKETQLSDDYVGTERLLQVITALIPASLWSKTGESDNPNKVYTYSMKAKCLKEFQDIYCRAHDQNNPEDKRVRELYRFYLDIAPQALELYGKWKSHQGFAGTKIHSITRNKGEIVDVPDGIIFPILASLSNFAKKTNDGWRIVPPASFKDEEIIRAAKSVYQDMASSNPWLMGKNKACYFSLSQITSIYQRLSA